MGKLVSKVMGGGDAAKDAKRQQAAAEAKAAELRAQQEAAQARLQQTEDAREEDLDKKAAAQRRGIVARRSGRSQLSFTGPLKSKFGE